MTSLPSPIPHPLDYLPWDVPGWVYDALALAVGVEWPEGNEKLVWDLADQWYSVATALQGPRDDAFEAAGEVLAGYGSSGMVGQAFDKAWRQVAEGDEAALVLLLTVTNDLGKLVEECGCDIEGAKFEVWIEVGLLVVELLALAVAVVLTAGAASPAAAGVIAATRMAIQAIFRKLVAQLARKALKKGAKEAAEKAAKQASKQGLKGFARRAGIEGLKEAGEEAGIELATQTYQAANGRRDGLDLKSLGTSAFGGLAGGAVAPLAGLGRHMSGRGARFAENVGREMSGEMLAETAAGLATGGKLPGLDDMALAAGSGARSSATTQSTELLNQRLDGLSSLSGLPPTTGALPGSLPPLSPTADLAGPPSAVPSGSSPVPSVPSGGSPAGGSPTGGGNLPSGGSASGGGLPAGGPGVDGPAPGPSAGGGAPPPSGDAGPSVPGDATPPVPGDVATAAAGPAAAPPAAPDLSSLAEPPPDGGAPSAPSAWSPGGASPDGGPPSAGNGAQVSLAGMTATAEPVTAGAAGPGASSGPGVSSPPVHTSAPAGPGAVAGVPVQAGVGVGPLAASVSPPSTVGPTPAGTSTPSAFGTAGPTPAPTPGGATVPPSPSPSPSSSPTPTLSPTPPVTSPAAGPATAPPTTQSPSPGTGQPPPALAPSTGAAPTGAHTPAPGTPQAPPPGGTYTSRLASPYSDGPASPYSGGPASPYSSGPASPANPPYSSETPSPDAVPPPVVTPPHPAEQRERNGYAAHLRLSRTGHESVRRHDEALPSIKQARQHQQQADNAVAWAEYYDQMGEPQLAQVWRDEARTRTAWVAYFNAEVDGVLDGTVVPHQVHVDPSRWHDVNADAGHLSAGPVETGPTSALTGTDVPPSADRTRPYGQYGGLRPPLALHQRDLEHAMPRRPDGTVVRTADPRQGDWFGLANDGGPGADPTRSINCQDCVISLYETWVHGRPRVSAPRTFDSYAEGDVQRPLGGEVGGPQRAEDLTGGRYQTLLPDTTTWPPDYAAHAVDQAYTNLHYQLLDGGHGSMAFIIHGTPDGAAHAWAAINQNGTILYVDPQNGAISENLPLYGNVTCIDAMVLGPDTRPMPLPNHEPGRWTGYPAPPPDPQPSVPLHAGPALGDDDLYVNKVHLLEGPAGAPAPGSAPGPGDQLPDQQTSVRADEPDAAESTGRSGAGAAGAGPPPFTQGTDNGSGTDFPTHGSLGEPGRPDDHAASGSEGNHEVDHGREGAARHTTDPAGSPEERRPVGQRGPIHADGPAVTTRIDLTASHNGEPVEGAPRNHEAPSGEPPRTTSHVQQEASATTPGDPVTGSSTRALDVLNRLPGAELSQLVPLPTLGDGGLPVRRGESGLIDAVRVGGEWVDVKNFVGRLADERTKLWKQYSADPAHPEIRKQLVQPCISVAVDRRTGELSEGHNRLKVTMALVHPLLRARIADYVARCEASGTIHEWGTPYLHPSAPGEHSEIFSVNELLWRREAVGIMVDDATLAELRIDNRFPWIRGGSAAPCCANCAAIIPDVPCNAGKFPGFPPDSDGKWEE